MKLGSTRGIDAVSQVNHLDALVLLANGLTTVAGMRVMLLLKK